MTVGPSSEESSEAEFVLGYFVAIVGLLKVVNVYVTTDRIIVNKRPIPLYWRVHVLEVAVIALGPIFPGYIAILILIAIAIATVTIFVRNRTLRKRPWPSINDIRTGRRLFEVEKGRVLSIELKKPTRFGTGSFSITSLFIETFHGKVQRGKSFSIAKDLLIRFDQQRVKFVTYASNLRLFNAFFHLEWKLPKFEDLRSSGL